MSNNFYFFILTGGHTREILCLVEKIGSKYDPRYYIIADTDQISEQKVHALERQCKSRDETEIKVYRHGCTKLDSYTFILSVYRHGCTKLDSYIFILSVYRHGCTKLDSYTFILSVYRHGCTKLDSYLFILSSDNFFLSILSHRVMFYLFYFLSIFVFFIYFCCFVCWSKTDKFLSIETLLVQHGLPGLTLPIAK